MARSSPERDGTGEPASTSDLHESVFVSPDAPVYDVPMHVVHRPLQSFTDENKVQTFMREMQRGDHFTPIEVLWVNKDDNDYYFAFGGCHSGGAMQGYGYDVHGAGMTHAQTLMRRHLGAGHMLPARWQCEQCSLPPEA